MKYLLAAFAMVAAFATMAYEGLANNRRSVLLFIAGFLAGWFV